jgi:hypothetical protein
MTKSLSEVLPDDNRECACSKHPVVFYLSRVSKHMARGSSRDFGSFQREWTTGDDGLGGNHNRMKGRWLLFSEFVKRLLVLRIGMH